LFSGILFLPPTPDLTVYVPNAPPFLPLPHLKIERLREEGYLKIKEQQELLKQQLLKQGDPADDSDEDSLPTLKVTWKAKKSDVNNGGYSQKLLEDIFSQVAAPL